MAIEICPVTPGFAAEIGDVDLSRPLAADDVEAIQRALWQYSVLVFPEQNLSQDQHVEFARHFGPLETSRAIAPVGGHTEFADMRAAYERCRPLRRCWFEPSPKVGAGRSTWLRTPAGSSACPMTRGALCSPS